MNSHYNVKFSPPKLDSYIICDELEYPEVVFVRDKFSEDEPTLIFLNGTKIWIFNNLYHRLTGPAIIRADGLNIWYRNGMIHRDDLPAVEYANGVKEWWTNGKFKHSTRFQHVDYETSNIAKNNKV